jgi:NAD(P)H-hydrate epimerase
MLLAGDIGGTKTNLAIFSTTAGPRAPLAGEEFGLGILQMMENAGRSLAEHVLEMVGEAGEVVILVGGGGNGGGGLCCGRHLHNRGVPVRFVLDRAPSQLTGAAKEQYRVLGAAGLQPADLSAVETLLRRAALVVDALIGYSLRGAPRGRAAALIELCNRHAGVVLSLDVPSGLDATTGVAPGAVIRPTRTLTLALPKTGLEQVPGELYLADIGIPPELYRLLGIAVGSLWGPRYWVRLERGA